MLIPLYTHLTHLFHHTHDSISIIPPSTYHYPTTFSLSTIFIPAKPVPLFHPSYFPIDLRSPNMPLSNPSSYSSPHPTSLYSIQSPNPFFFHHSMNPFLSFISQLEKNGPKPDSVFFMEELRTLMKLMRLCC